jgi:hypothetical protein
MTDIAVETNPCAATPSTLLHAALRLAVKPLRDARVVGTEQRQHPHASGAFAPSAAGRISLASDTSSCPAHPAALPHQHYLPQERCHRRARGCIAPFLAWRVRHRCERACHSNLSAGQRAPSTAYLTSDEPGSGASVLALEMSQPLVLPCRFEKRPAARTWRSRGEPATSQ